MPRLPTLDDLGSRPTPVSRRSISSNPRAGAVGGAIAGIGNDLMQTGQRMIKEQIEKEDRLAYAKAKSELLKEDVIARKELETDPDYETWETRYTERMKAARERASGMIKSSADRALFEQDAEITALKGGSDLAKGAYARRVDSEVAGGKEQLFELQDVAQNAPDDAAREEVIANASDLIAGMQAKGYISAEDAGKLRRDWTQNYIVQRIETLRSAEDYDGALKFFDANRGRLDQATESRIGSLLVDASNNRESLILAEKFVTGGLVTGEAGAVPAVSRGRKPAEAAVESQLGAAGFSPVVVAGFLGNFEVEGGYGGARGDGGKAVGIAQWHPDRQANFRRLYGKDISRASHAEQAKFVAWEMANPTHPSVGMTVKQRDEILAAKTPEEAARLIDKYYERSSGAHRAKRESAAREFHGGTGGSTPKRRDLGEIYANIDARASEEGWTPEKTERVKSQAARLVQREDTLLDREQADAYEAALAKAEALGEDYTDPSQLGDAYYRASEIQQRTMRSMAEANARAKAAAREPEANGDVAVGLSRMAAGTPADKAKFAELDLRVYRPFLSKGEYAQFAEDQARIAAALSKPVNAHGMIDSTITGMKKWGLIDVDKNPIEGLRVRRYMETQADEFLTQYKKRPAKEDFDRWFKEATAAVTVETRFLGIGQPSVSKRRSSEFLSPNMTAMIRREFRQTFGREPNEAEIKQWFDRMGEAIK